MFALMNAWMCVASLLGIAAGHRVKILRTKALGFLGRVIDDLDRANDEHFAGLGDLEEALPGFRGGGRLGVMRCAEIG
jgi:hypothetical protein